MNVTIDSATPGATIRYTTDGTIPSSTNGTAISSGSTVLVSQAETLRAIALASGTIASDVASTSFTFNSTPSYIYYDNFTGNDYSARYTNIVHGSMGARTTGHTSPFPMAWVSCLRMFIGTAASKRTPT